VLCNFFQIFYFLLLTSCRGILLSSKCHVIQNEIIHRSDKSAVQNDVTPGSDTSDIQNKTCLLIKLMSQFQPNFAEMILRFKWPKLLYFMPESAKI
jgi:hypothetical protein